MASKRKAKVAVQAPSRETDNDVITEIPPAKTAAQTNSKASETRAPPDSRIEQDVLVAEDDSQDITTTPPSPDDLSPQPSPTMPPSTGPISLLICSIGNPGAPYANTLHSAGHTVLLSLARLLNAPPLSKDRTLANGSSTHLHNPPWTLWQSPSYMNESGPAVLKAFHAWSRTLPPGHEGRLVVVHDELEKSLGAVSVKDGTGSAKGHNGLKSLLAHQGQTKVVRVGVGIGRPVSRSSEDVSRFVLRKMTPGEKMKVEGAAEEVVETLMGISGG